LKQLTLAIAVSAFCFLGAAAQAQQIDFGFGWGTVLSPGPTTSNGLYYPSIRGGGYPAISADFLLKHNFGVEGDISWRASQNNYAGNQPYRPIFWSFNGIWTPRISKNVVGEVLAGIGGEDLRFYGIVNCTYYVGCTNYSSSNHFLGSFGGGVRVYVWHSVFIRPEGRLYLVNNNHEFSSGTVFRVGGTLGYSFGK
jgi:hypothetical protein